MHVVLSITVMLGIFLLQSCMTVSVATIQLEVSAAFMQMSVSASNMWVTIFIVFMEVYLFQYFCFLDRPIKGGDISNF